MEDRMKVERYTLFDERRTVLKFTIDDKVMEDAIGPERRAALKLIEELGFPLTAASAMVTSIAAVLEAQRLVAKDKEGW